MGSKAIGKTLKEEFKLKSGCSLNLINGGSSSQLESKVIIQPRRYHAVIGLQYDSSLTGKISWSGDKKQFSYSPMIVLAKGENIKEIIVPDEAKSEVGKNYFHENINLDLKVKKSSSWTQGLSLFNKSEDISFYTFAGSLFYFNQLNRKSKKKKAYYFLPEVRGFYKEYFRFLSDDVKFKKAFEESIFSMRVQESLWLKNYMYPIKKEFYPSSLSFFVNETGLK